MSKLVNFTVVVALAALFFCVYIEARATSTPVPTSYLDDIKLSYNSQNDVWQCDILTCPFKTVGCRISVYNDVNKTSSLWHVNRCYDSSNINTFSLFHEKPNRAAGRNVTINIKSFRGDSTDLVYGYSNTSQTVNGTARWEDWPNVQLQYRGIILEASQNRTFLN